MARPERLELPTLWFEAVGKINLSRVFAVASGPRHALHAFQALFRKFDSDAEPFSNTSPKRPLAGFSWLLAPTRRHSGSQPSGGFLDQGYRHLGERAGTAIAHS
jgi:hypothetical protein